MKYFTGIDVSLRSVSICVVDEAGEVRYEAKVAAEIDVIVPTLRRFSRNMILTKLSVPIDEAAGDNGLMERVETSSHK